MTTIHQGAHNFELPQIPKKTITIASTNPTAAELVAGLGSAATAGAGTLQFVTAAANAKPHLVVSNGTAWVFVAMTTSS